MAAQIFVRNPCDEDTLTLPGPALVFIVTVLVTVCSKLDLIASWHSFNAVLTILSVDSLAIPKLIKIYNKIDNLYLYSLTINNSNLTCSAVDVCITFLVDIPCVRELLASRITLWRCDLADLNSEETASTSLKSESRANCSRNNTLSCIITVHKFATTYLIPVVL